MTQRSMNGMRLSFAGLSVMVLALGVPAFAGFAELPNQGLEDRIEFWKKVYTQYGEDDVIIHDRIRVNLIYDVAARGEQQGKMDAVRQALDEIRSNLDTPENLSSTSKSIRDVLIGKNVPLTSDSLADLRDNVHSQLGIKERFRE